MTTFFYYLLEVSVINALFYFGYWLFLKNETNFSFGRFYLLISLLMALSLPLLNLRFVANAIYPSNLDDLQEMMPSNWLPQMEIGKPVQEQTSQPVLVSVFQSMYWIGLSIFLMRMLFDLIKLNRYIRQAKRKEFNGTRVFELGDHDSSFSFFKYIFIGNPISMSEEEAASILAHERVHTSRLHSFDIIFLDLIRAFLWFNPIIYFYKKTLVQLHEFEADSRAVEDFGQDRYCGLLAKAALSSSGFAIA
jgi:BlaR1 peptidase M56